MEEGGHADAAVPATADEPAAPQQPAAAYVGGIIPKQLVLGDAEFARFCAGVHRMRGEAKRGSPKGLLFVRLEGAHRMALSVHSFREAVLRFIHTAQQVPQDIGSEECAPIADAQCMLGMMFEDGYGFPRNVRRAVALYSLSSALGHAISPCLMGAIYAKGGAPAELWSDEEWDQGIEKDFVRSFELYTLSAERGNVAAICNIGAVFELGRQPLQQPDIRRAAEYYQRAIDMSYTEECRLQGSRGYASALYNLALLSYKAHGAGGVLSSEKRARELFLQAGELGHGGALLVLGNMVFPARPATERMSADQAVPRDMRESFECFYKAAMLGESSGLFNMGVGYERGDMATELDYARAAQFYRLSRALSHEGAADRLENAGWMKGS